METTTDIQLQLVNKLNKFQLVAYCLLTKNVIGAALADLALYNEYKDFFDKIPLFDITYKPDYKKSKETRYYNICCNIIKLTCWYNQLTALPNLPNCKKLKCWVNRLKTLPALPSCKKLNCSGNPGLVIDRTTINADCDIRA